jgi:hypothetical protein
MKIWGTALALFLSVCCTATAQVKKPDQVPTSPKARKQPLLITIDIASATLKAGSAISVNMLMTNKSRHPISVGWGSSELSGEIVVRDSQGNKSLTELERCLRERGQCNTSSNPWGPCAVEGEQCQTLYYLPMGGGPSFPLDPGKSYSESVEVNQRAYDLTRPGKYTIQWQGQCHCSQNILTSNTINLTLIP